MKTPGGSPIIMLGGICTTTAPWGSPGMLPWTTCVCGWAGAGAGAAAKGEF